VRVPKLTSQGWRHDYQKLSRVAQSWAIVGACALVRRQDGQVAEARVGLTNMGTTPVRARAVEAVLSGAAAEPGALAAGAEHAADDTDPPADLDAHPDYRARLARVLVRRALEAAIA